MSGRLDLLFAYERFCSEDKLTIAVLGVEAALVSTYGVQGVQVGPACCIPASNAQQGAGRPSKIADQDCKHKETTLEHFKYCQ